MAQAAKVKEEKQAANGAAPMEEDAPKLEVPEQSDAERVAAQLVANVALIEKSVRAKETRMGSGRLLRTTAVVRRRLTRGILQTFMTKHLPQDSPLRPDLLAALEQLPDEMEAEEVAAAPSVNLANASAASAVPEAAVSSLPEVEVYASLLALLLLTDAKRWPEAKRVATATVERLAVFNRRTLDVLAARIYHYLSLSHERTGTLPSIRTQLLGLHRTAVLRHDEVGQETLLNLLLRNHLACNMYDQAEALRSKVQRPETSRSATQAARYLYYHGRIQAVQLDYTAARDSLQQAARKAPIAAYAFRAEVAKWLVLVRLLLSDVPERTELTAPGLATALRPYFELAAAVRVGDLTAFREVAERHADVWARDHVANLVVRLRQNVLRAGLARMGAAYSRISLADVAAKLGVASAADAESIVAKVIRDGGLEASIDHEAGVMLCREAGDVYATAEPAAAFHARTAFCLDIHNEAVRAMRFEEGAYRRRKGESEEARAERVKNEAELSAALAEEDDDDMMDF